MGRTPLNWLLAVVSLLGMYLFMGWTLRGGLQNIKYWLYTCAQITQLQSQTKILIRTGYYFAVLLVSCNIFLRYVLPHLISQSPPRSSEKRQAIQPLYQALVTSVFSFIIFIGFFAYLTQMSTNKLPEDKLTLIGFWFLLGRVVSIMGFVLASATELNTRMFGRVLTYYTYAVILAQIHGYEPFQWL